MQRRATPQDRRAATSITCEEVRSQARRAAPGHERTLLRSVRETPVPAAVLANVGGMRTSLRVRSPGGLSAPPTCDRRQRPGRSCRFIPTLINAMPYAQRRNTRISIKIPGNGKTQTIQPDRNPRSGGKSASRAPTPRWTMWSTDGGGYGFLVAATGSAS